ncbi:MAG: hypothetical protein ACYDHZ_00345 [Dehalococcoidia bacterium]
MKIVNLRKQNNGQLRAFFDVVFENKGIPVLTLHDMKLIENETGIWPAAPGAAHTENGRQVYEPHYSIDCLQMMDQIGKEAVKVYHGRR